MHQLPNHLYARTVVEDRRREAAPPFVGLTARRRRPSTPWRARLGHHLVRVAEGVDRLGRRLQPDAGDCRPACLEAGVR